MNSKEIKHYYFILNNESLVAYSDDKEMVENFIHTRKKKYKVKKIKVKKLKEDNINLNHIGYKEIVYPVCGDIPLTMGEEEYFYESLGQYFLDLEKYIGDFLRHLEKIKFDDDEKEPIKRLTDFISNRYCEIRNPSYDFDGMEYLMEIFDMNEMLTWFVENWCE